MNAQWHVGLTGGYEICVRADEAAVQDGCLTLLRRSARGPSRVIMSLKAGEWTSLLGELAEAESMHAA